MNDMLGTLQLIDRQTDALARGDLRSPSLTEVVPGNLGKSLPRVGGKPGSSDQRLARIRSTGIGDHRQRSGRHLDRVGDGSDRVGQRGR